MADFYTLYPVHLPLASNHNLLQANLVEKRSLKGGRLSLEGGDKWLWLLCCKSSRPQTKWIKEGNTADLYIFNAP